MDHSANDILFFKLCCYVLLGYFTCSGLKLPLKRTKMSFFGGRITATRPLTVSSGDDDDDDDDEACI